MELDKEVAHASLGRRSFLAGVAGVGLLGLTGCAPASPASVTSKDLRAAIKGRVLLPGDPGFTAAARPWNRAVTQRIRAVVEIADAADAVAVVGFARDAGYTASAQPTGHGAADGLDGVILVRTGRLTELHVDPDARTARAGAGLAWGQVLPVAGQHGLTGLAGSSPAVSVTGFTLGGGLSWFGRRYGWACDSVTAFDIVDADGHAGRVTAGSDPDLFWAMRGGGGDFALVTAIEFGLHPAPAVFGGRMVWPADRGPDVMAAFREVTAQAPDELTVWFLRMAMPGGPPVVAIASAYLGAEAQARALLSPFDRIDGRVADTRATIPVAALGGIMSEPVKPDAAVTRSEMVTDIDDAAAAALLRPAPSLAVLQIRHLGGAWTRSSGSAAGSVSARYCVIATGMAPAPPAAAAVDTGCRQLAAELGPVLAGRTPFTFLGPGDTADRAFPPDTLARLRDIKRRRDPRNVIRSNFPVQA